MGRSYSVATCLADTLRLEIKFRKILDTMKCKKLEAEYEVMIRGPQKKFR